MLYGLHGRCMYVCVKRCAIGIVTKIFFENWQKHNNETNKFMMVKEELYEHDLHHILPCPIDM